MTSQLATYDFRISTEESRGTSELPCLLKELSMIAKKYTFQLEKGETGYIHWQGRMSLIKKKRINELIALVKNDATPILSKGYFCPTSNNGIDVGDFYVMKLDTRISGPWSDKDESIKELLNPPYIPRQVREITQLYQWQTQIKEQLAIWDTRKINCVICQKGGEGKSTLISCARAFKWARVLPSVNDTKDLLRMVCDMPTSTAYMFDMPRAMNKDKLYQFYAAIETIKDGYAYDDRYHFTEKVFDCPNIWIFCNKIPDTSLLSADRWNFHTIHEKVLWDYYKLEDHLEDVKQKADSIFKKAI